jgi:hypothetical protein
MTLRTFIDEIIAQGTPVAETDYANRPEELESAKAGFEACRNKDVMQLKELLAASQKKENEAYTAAVLDSSKMVEFKKARAFSAEVNWVCNVLSAVLQEHKLTPIIPPTARGVLVAGDILDRAAL